MNLLTAIMRALGWPPPAVTVPTRRRRLRATCEGCGKEIAVIASTGKLWAHHCQPPAPDEQEPDDALVHDTWDEHRGLR